ncbi:MULTISPECIES: DUF6482 family protein [Pseudomonas]|uniref:Metal ABC transporter ATPase n=1 Tax=Pseudomonas nitroreducens TaxID=46680 RepID=A0A246F5M7_PSENT|nr:MULTISPECIES: DUF6482 family protein [Pseudomonas]MCG8906787.1 DUF6482 family protein [Pseudomonas sp. DP-17]OWP48515.1 metal ABC transporter ATPase [Pseudomonas nitroreducens]
MTMQELAQAAAAGRVLGFEAISLEGGFYVLQARLAEGLRPVRDDDGQVLHLRSTTQVREALRDWASLPCELVQHCAHDEICSAHPTAVQPLRVALSLEPRE